MTKQAGEKRVAVPNDFLDWLQVTKGVPTPSSRLGTQSAGEVSATEGLECACECMHVYMHVCTHTCILGSTGSHTPVQQTDYHREDEAK